MVTKKELFKALQILKKLKGRELLLRDLVFTSESGCQVLISAMEVPGTSKNYLKFFLSVRKQYDKNWDIKILRSDKRLFNYLRKRNINPEELFYMVNKYIIESI